MHLTIPLKKEDIASLRIRDIVFLSGRIITARDMAHIRMMERQKKGKKQVENFNGAAIFHAGPVLKNNNGKWELSVIGPTTSMRMEPFSELVFGKLRVKVLIGKGGMGDGTLSALKKYGGVYLLSPPGCAVIQSKSVQKVLGVHWLDLGMPEAMWVLDVKELGPLVVAMDSKGQSIFAEVKKDAMNHLNRIMLKNEEYTSEAG
jgi:fumarate hydratase subunit beta/L(+)-tartrate dehydratase beta subunit